MTIESPSTNEKAIPISVEAIIKEAKRIEENCLYTSKSHFVAASFWDNFHLWIGVPTVVLAAIAGAIALAEFDYHTTIAASLSMLIMVLTAVTTFLNPKERSNTYLTAGNNYDSLLTKVRIFWTIDCWSETPNELLCDKLKEFSEHRDRLNRDCPQPSTWAHNKAKKGIEEGEAVYMVDKEI